MPGSPVEEASIAPSPRDLRIYLEGSSTEEGRSDLQGIPVLEITHPPSLQQSRDAERAADPEVTPPLHSEQRQEPLLRPKPTCQQQRPRGDLRKRLRKDLSPALPSREESRRREREETVMVRTKLEVAWDCRGAGRGEGGGA